jgi:hypothetical protein
MSRPSLPRRLLLAAGLSLLPALLLGLLAWRAGAPGGWLANLPAWIFSAAVLALAGMLQPTGSPQAGWRLPGLNRWLLPAIIAACLLSALAESTPLAWLGLAGFYACLLGWLACLEAGTAWPVRLFLEAAFSAAAGIGPALVVQAQSGFADEEFFAAAEVLALMLFWLVLRLAFLRWPFAGPERGAPLGLRRGWLAGLLASGALAAGLAGLRAYQDSFFPAQAPAYPGITSEAPFLCGESEPDPQVYDGQLVFRELLRRVEVFVDRSSPEFGMLALGTGEQRWAQAFKQRMLEEAAAGLYTGPTHSIKYRQYQASQRLYYYPLVTAAFPGLFNPAEDAQIREWFAAINRRAMTVEWVDLLYAVALGKLPEGPYENQENGAGLLALLEVSGLSDPHLSAANRAYLARNPRGWLERFRNTDDTFTYQPEWIENAWLQSMYTGELPAENLRLSFDWLALQALPDGRPFNYNHIYTLPLGSIASLGMHLLQDEHYLWLAGRSLEYMASVDYQLLAQIGAEKPFPGQGHSPDFGSCLVYGDSGLPTKKGPLAPDKIIFRSGWAADGSYLMLNLRFSGWHRYKATNNIVLIHQQGALLREVMDAEPINWLPLGRATVRDKRLPRENLNGLVVARRGLGAVLQRLTRLGSPWAQDPPYYAEVLDFQTGREMDSSVTRIQDWHGWQHRRSIYFYHAGPVVIVDEAAGPPGAPAALVWHLAGPAKVDGNRLRLRPGGQPADVLLYPLAGATMDLQPETAPAAAGGFQAQYRPAGDGRLRAVTVFLTRDWAEAQSSLEQTPQGASLRLQLGEQVIRLPLQFGMDADER